MTLDELEDQLRAWGRAYGEDRAAEWDEGPRALVSSYGANTIARGMDFAPDRRTEIIRQRTSMDRGGQGRRRLMGAAAGIVTHTGLPGMLPGAFVDPVPCRESRTHQGTPRADPRFTPKVERVQTAVLTLLRFDTLRGTCVQVEYQVRGARHIEKADMVGLRVGHRVNLKRYRDELARAKLWLHGRLAA